MARGGGKARAGGGRGSFAAGGGKGGGAATRRSSRPSAVVADDFAVSDSDGDNEAVHALRPPVGRRRGGGEDSEGDDSDGMGEEVLGLAASDDDDDDDDESLGEDDAEEDDDDEDEDAMIEREIARGGRAGELARQAKAIGAKLKLQRGGDDDEDDGEDGEADDKGTDLWGASKRHYYDADTAALEGSDAEEAFAEEEEEGARLEAARLAKLRASDFGLDDDDKEEEEEEDSDGEDGGEATMGARAKGKMTSSAHGGVEVEEVTKQLDSLSAEQRSAALLADAPELLALLQDLTDTLSEARMRVGPVLQEIRSGGLATSEGISYLEAKYLLLLQYCTHIVFYILLKAEGRPVKDHPVITRLVELRAYMEKIRPIDKRLQYQIDRLIKAAQIASNSEGGSKNELAGDEAAKAAADAGDELHFGPRREQLVASSAQAQAAEDAEHGEGAAGVYRPPKINPVSMEGDAEASQMTRNEARLLKEARRKAQRSELVAELAADVAGAPRELRHEVPGFDSLAAVKQRQKLEARATVEEDMMSRVPLSKEEAKKMKAQRRAGMSGKFMLDDFADEVADIVGMAQAGEGKKGSRLSDLLSRQKVSQKFGADAPRPEIRGGDEDVPRRMPLHERRLKHDSVAAQRAAAADDGMDGDDDDLHFGGGVKRGAKRPSGVEDDLYKQAQASAAERKRAKADRFGVADAMPPLPDDTADGARAITDAIERNRGLTPHRRKDIKNPRKKHRLAFQKAQVRRKGAVQDVRAPSAAYGGEATGVKGNVVKSRRMG